jgi:predicted RNase H-like nuclease (RuvC/YqgF family)
MEDICMERPSVGLMKKQWRQIDHLKKLIREFHKDIEKIEERLNSIKVKMEDLGDDC